MVATYLKVGSAKNVKELIKTIQQYIESHNQNPKVFIRTASVESIMRKISKCKGLLETGHYDPQRFHMYCPHW